ANGSCKRTAFLVLLSWQHSNGQSGATRRRRKGVSVVCTSRHALVTGASTGMGRAIALSLAGCGFHVFVGVRHFEDGEALQAQSHGQLTPLIMDVTRYDQIARSGRAVSEHVVERGLNVLVNNAGVGQAWPLEIVPLDRFRTQFAVNVDGQLAVTQTFLPLIR